MSLCDNVRVLASFKPLFRMLTARPHIAGSDENKNLAYNIFSMWKGYGFDSVEVFNYSVLLSYPNTSNPNTLTLRQADTQILYDSHIALEPPLTAGVNNSNVAPPFNANSGSGNVTVKLHMKPVSGPKLST